MAIYTDKMEGGVKFPETKTRRWSGAMCSYGDAWHSITFDGSAPYLQKMLSRSDRRLSL